MCVRMACRKILMNAKRLNVEPRKHSAPLPDTPGDKPCELYGGAKTAFMETFELGAFVCPLLRSPLITGPALVGKPTLTFEVCIWVQREHMWEARV